MFAAPLLEVTYSEKPAETFTLAEHSQPYVPPPIQQAMPTYVNTAAPHPFPKTNQLRFKPLSPLPSEENASKLLPPPPDYQATVPAPYCQPVQQGAFPQKTLHPSPLSSQQQAPAMVRRIGHAGLNRCRPVLT